MKIIAEIVNFLRLHKRYQGKIIDRREWKRDNSDRFFDTLLDKEFLNDDEAAKHLFGYKDHRYKDLKSRLLNNLISSVLIIEPHSQDLATSSKKYYALIREIAVAKIMVVKTFHHIAAFFAKRCYRKAKEFGFYDIMYDAVWILKYYSGAMTKNESAYFKYNRELTNIMTILQLENKAYSYYIESLIMHKKSRFNLESCYSFSTEKFKELSPYLNECDSSRFQLITRLIRTISNSSKSDYEAMLHNSNEDIEYWNQKYKERSNALYIFLVQKTTACIRLGLYKKGLDTILFAGTMVSEKSINWFPLKHNEYFIYMQSGEYEKAQKLYLKVTNHRRYKTLVPHMKEDWIIGGAYLNYIIEKRELEPHSKFKFKLGKFINSVPEYSKDRRVKNIPILIAQIIFMIYRKQTGKVIDRMDAIKQYCGRNLRYNEAVRSNSFIMALMEIPKCSFNRKAVDRRIGRFTKRLQEVPLHQSGKNFDLEIIPYERLLGYVLEDL